MKLLKLEDLADGRRARLLEAFEVRLPDGRLVQVPAGFVVDFASTPRILWSILPPRGRYSRAAVVHDWLYRTQGVSRKYADDVFLWMMEELEVPLWKRRVMYRGVRVWGWRTWRKHAQTARANAMWAQAWKV